MPFLRDARGVRVREGLSSLIARYQPRVHPDDALAGARLSPYQVHNHRKLRYRRGPHWHRMQDRNLAAAASLRDGGLDD